MVKIVYCISKKAGMSDAAFHRYWLETHGPIAARVPGLRRYVQSHALPSVAGLPEHPYDGVAEVWFDNVEGLTAAMRSAEVHAALEDEKNFIDHSKVALFVCREHVIVESRPLV